MLSFAHVCSFHCCLGFLSCRLIIVIFDLVFIHSFIHSFTHSLTHSLIPTCRAHCVENVEAEALIWNCFASTSHMTGEEDYFCTSQVIGWVGIGWVIVSGMTFVVKGKKTEWKCSCINQNGVGKSQYGRRSRLCCDVYGRWSWLCCDMSGRRS